jgi:hypothetical protein
MPGLSGAGILDEGQMDDVKFFVTGARVFACKMV